MNNTAKKLNAKEIADEFQSTYGNYDLLKVFLITGATDISKSTEIVERWRKNAASNQERDDFTRALNLLKAIELKRIELTAIVYDIETSNTIDVKAEEVTPVEKEEGKEEGKVILMLPHMNTILERVSLLFLDPKNKNANSDAFKLMNQHFLNGKVVDDSGNPVIWTHKQISDFVKAASEAIKTEDVKEEIVKDAEIIVENVKQPEHYGFETIHGALIDVINNGATVEQAKSFCKNMLIGKIIKEKNSADTYLIADEIKFEDYWTRILSALAESLIKTRETKKETPADNLKKAQAEVEKEIIPFLKNEEKDPTKTSLAPATMKFNTIYKSFGLNIPLSDAITKVKEYAKKYAPNLIKRNEMKVAEKVNTALNTSEKDKLEIYDESHNIKESNKELWAKVEKYETIDQIFSEASALVKTGNWQDALNMTILLLETGKIKEKIDSKETLKWDKKQTQQWFETNVLSTNKQRETKVEKIKTEDKIQPIGPVPIAGSIEPAKERVTRLFKSTVTYKGDFTSTEIPTDNNEGSMLVQVLTTIPTEDPNFIGVKDNINKYLEEQTALLVENQNNYPKVKDNITATLDPIYDLTSADIKRIVGALARNAKEIRKHQQIDKKYEKLKAKEESKTEETKETADQEAQVENPQSPAENQDTAGSSEKKDSSSPETTTATEKSHGEELSSSDRKAIYEEFRDILKAKTKLEYHVAIFNKVMEYEKEEDGIKAVFNAINLARKDKSFKNNQVHLYRPTPQDEILKGIHNIVEKGKENAKKK